jgi:hypothetical protein
LLVVAVAVVVETQIAMKVVLEVLEVCLQTLVV